MRARFAFTLGLRLLRGKAGTARYVRGSILGIAVSLVPLIVVMEVSTGMIDGITSRLLEISTYHLRVSLASDTDEETLHRDSFAVAEGKDVVDVIPERQGIGLVFSRGRSAGVTVRFVPPDLFSRDEGLKRLVTMKDGSADLSSRDTLLLGAALAEGIGVKAGDKVILLTPYGEDGKGPPKITVMRVGGTLQTGYQELEKLYAYASLDASWSVLSPRASTTAIGVKVKDPFSDLSASIADIRSRLPDVGRVLTWQELSYGRLKSFQTTKALLLFIMALIVLVAGVNVSSAVIMITFERRFEIGILKSVGASPSSLSFSFLTAGFMTGLLGTIAGIGVGLLAAVNINQIIAALQWAVNLALGVFSSVRRSLAPSAPALEPVTIFNSAYYLTTIPIRIHWLDVFLASFGALVLSGIASYIPASRASRMRPLEVIRKV
jgi:lipoprotein-releasing system permease protein